MSQAETTIVARILLEQPAGFTDKKVIIILSKSKYNFIEFWSDKCRMCKNSGFGTCSEPNTFGVGCQMASWMVHMVDRGVARGIVIATKDYTGNNFGVIQNGVKTSAVFTERDVLYL